MEYEDYQACWKKLKGASVEAAATALRKHADDLELKGKPGKTLLEGKGEPSTLIIVCADADADVSLWCVPDARIDPKLRKALGAIQDRVFAGSADLSGPQWDAAVLVMSALAHELSSADDLASWASDEGSSLSAKEIKKYWDHWKDTRVTKWSELGAPVTQVVAFQRAM